MITAGSWVFGDLTQVQDWLRWNDDGRDWTIHVTGHNKVKGCTWRHGREGQVFAFVGPGTLDGNGNKSWCVSWQSPATAHFKDLVIRGFTRGGIVAGQGHVRCVGVHFKMIGSISGLSPLHSKHGLAGLMINARATGVAQDCAFWNLVNSNLCLVRMGKCAAVLHAVYVQGGSARVFGCTFNKVSGDPIRVRDGGSVTVKNTASVASGVNAMVSGWGDYPGTVTFLGENVPVSLFDGKRSLLTWRLDNA